MAQVFYYPPLSASNSSIGANGATAPSSSTEVGGIGLDGNLHALSTDNSGVLNVNAASLPLPSGAATAAKQDTGNTSLASIDTKVTGVSTSAKQDTGNTSLSSIDTKLSSQATAAKQDTGNTSLASIDGKTPALGQALAAASVPVVLTAAQLSTLTPLATVAATQSGTWNITNISGTITLPSGAATSTLQGTANTSLASIDTKTPALGQALAAASVPVVLTAAQLSTLTPLSTIAATQSGTWNITNVSGTISLPTGAATETTLAAMSAKLPATLGQKAMSAALAVSIASDQSTINVAQAGKAFANAPVYNDYSSVNVTTSAYVQLVASTTSATTEIEIFDSSGQGMILAVGAAASEIDQIFIFPGGNGRVPLKIPAGSRVSIKAKTATASVGFIMVNFYA